MINKFIESKGFQIAYMEKNPNKGNTIFFIHGNSGSSRLWEKQFNDELFSDYRLIAFDLPAHGHSSASEEPEKDYSVIGLANIIANAVFKLNNQGPFILVGFSLGTNIVVEMLAFSVKPQGIVLLGADLIGGKYTLQEVFMPGVDTGMLFMDNAPIEQLKKFTELSISSKDEKDSGLIISDYNLVKPPFRSTLLKTAKAGKFSDEVAMLKESGVISLLIYGEGEKLLNTDYLSRAGLSLWGNTIFKIPGSNHYTNIDQPSLFNDLLFQYSEQILVEDYSR